MEALSILLIDKDTVLLSPILAALYKILLSFFFFFFFLSTADELGCQDGIMTAQ